MLLGKVTPLPLPFWLPVSKNCKMPILLTH